jgi:acyl carrier protein
MAEDVSKIIIDYIKKEYLEEDSTVAVTDQTKLISSGIVDSFSMVSLKMFLEKRFQIKIDSVSNIISLLKEFTKL